MLSTGASWCWHDELPGCRPAGEDAIVRSIAITCVVSTMSEFKFACPVCGQHITCDSGSSGSHDGVPHLLPQPRCAPGQRVPARPTSCSAHRKCKRAPIPLPGNGGGEAAGPSRKRNFPGRLWRWDWWCAPQRQPLLFFAQGFLARINKPMRVATNAPPSVAQAGWSRSARHELDLESGGRKNSGDARSRSNQRAELHFAGGDDQ